MRSARAMAHRRAKDIKNDVKQLKKELISAGCEKGMVNEAVKEFGEVLELGGSVGTAYREAREHLGRASAAIGVILKCMEERDPAEVRDYLEGLAVELEQGCHECLIQSDDQDYLSSVRCLKRMTSEGAQSDRGGMAFVMLRSELENIGAVLADVLGFGAPDFFALAYFFRRGDKDSLKEMENEQRNTYVLAFTKEHFLDAFLKECGRAGVGARVQEMIRRHIYGEQAGQEQ